MIKLFAFLGNSNSTISTTHALTITAIELGVASRVLNHDYIELIFPDKLKHVARAGGDVCTTENDLIYEFMRAHHGTDFFTVSASRITHPAGGDVRVIPTVQARILDLIELKALKKEDVEGIAVSLVTPEYKFSTAPISDSVL